jgi:hypothetical protein
MAKVDKMHYHVCMSTATAQIQIQQLDANGHVSRVFNRWASTPEHAEQIIDRIRMAYNMDHTRVLLHGRIVHEPNR